MSVFQCFDRVLITVSDATHRRGHTPFRPTLQLPRSILKPQGSHLAVWRVGPTQPTPNRTPQCLHHTCGMALDTASDPTMDITTDTAVDTATVTSTRPAVHGLQWLLMDTLISALLWMWLDSPLVTCPMPRLEQWLKLLSQSPWLLRLGCLQARATKTWPKQTRSAPCFPGSGCSLLWSPCLLGFAVLAQGGRLAGTGPFPVGR